MTRHPSVRLRLILPPALSRRYDASHKDGKVTLDDRANTGDTAGKELLEVYYNPPYTGGIAFQEPCSRRPGSLAGRLTVKIEFDDEISWQQECQGWEKVITPSPSSPIPTVITREDHAADTITYDSSRTPQR